MFCFLTAVLSTGAVVPDLGRKVGVPVHIGLPPSTDSPEVVFRYNLWFGSTVGIEATSPDSVDGVQPPRNLSARDVALFPHTLMGEEPGPGSSPDFHVLQGGWMLPRGPPVVWAFRGPPVHVPGQTRSQIGRYFTRLQLSWESGRTRPNPTGNKFPFPCPTPVLMGVPSFPSRGWAKGPPSTLGPSTDVEGGFPGASPHSPTSYRRRTSLPRG